MSQTKDGIYTKFKDNKTITNQPNNTQTVHVNILLESLSCPIIGLLIIKQTPNESITLSHLRECIKSQFDEDQLQTLGGADDFKFIMISSETLSNPTPVSKKQEKSINITEITISDTHTTTPTATITNSDTNEHEHKHNSHTPTNRSKRHYSVDIQHKSHHYKTIGQSLPTHLTVPSNNPSPPVHTSTSTTIPDIIYYSVLVRVANTTNTLTRFNSFLPLPANSPQLTTDTSMSIFERPTIATLKELQITLTKQHTTSETEIDLSQYSSSESSEPTIDTYIFRHKNVTQLERQFGGTLPRIRASKSRHKLAKPDHIQMTNILAHALVDNELQKLNPTKTAPYPILPTPTQLQSHLSLNDRPEQDEMSSNEMGSIDYTSKDNRCRFTVIGCPQFDDKSHQQTWIFYDPTELILGLQGVHHSEKAPVWMDLVCDEDTFTMISEHIKPSIHQLTIEDCITIECREKLELFDNYLFICIHTSVAALIERLYIIVFNSMIITYHTDYDNYVIREARHRMEQRHKHQHRARLSPGWITHTIVDAIVDKMIPQIQCRVQEVQNVENLVFALSGKSHNELLHRLQNARNELVVCRSKLWPKSTMTNNLVDEEWRVFLSGVPLQYWNDINDHVTRMVDLLNMGQSSLESCQNIFVAKISLEAAEQSNALSDSAGRLTAVGSVFLPLAYIAGLWGMNCKVPFQYEGPGEESLWGDSYYGFCIVVTMMVVMAIVTYKFSIKVL